jgi:hypothetical protein
MIPIQAHFDGRSVILDEPANLLTGQKVLVYAVKTREPQKNYSDAELDAILQPVRNAFVASGMSEDELAEFLETEKHAMRGDSRGRK